MVPAKLQVLQVKYFETTNNFLNTGSYISSQLQFGGEISLEYAFTEKNMIKTKYYNILYY